MTTTKVILIGTHCTGTTSLTELIARMYNKSQVPDPVRVVEDELGQTMPAIRGNLNAVETFQLRVFERKLELEETQPQGVYDQGFDNVAYAMAHTRYGKLILDSKEFAEYVKSLNEEGAVVFYVTPHRHMISDDGFRPPEDLDWGEVRFIDGIIFSLLVQHVPGFHVIAADKWFLRYKEVISVLGPPVNQVELPKDWCSSTKS